jgi:HK97 family phage prohead protease
MKNNKEIRALSPGTELRAVKTDGTMKLSGLAIPNGVRSADLGGFVEIAAAGLVKRSLRDQPRVLALRDHDPSKLLGSTSAKTLTLRDTPAGLAFDLTVPDTEVGRDTYENIRLGNLTGVSWGFTTRKDSWAQVDGKAVRTLHDIDLMEISPTAFPAYGKGTSVSVRSCPPEFRSLLGDIFGDLDILGNDDDTEDDSDEECPCGEHDEDGRCTCPDSDEDTNTDTADGQRHMRLQMATRRLR